MNGLPIGAAAPAAQPQAGQTPDELTIDVSQMDIPAMLMEKLNIDQQAVQQLLEALVDATTPEEAAMIIKSFDQNPETMDDKYDPVAQAQGAPAPAQAGLPIGK